jgi:hypothetical protein
MDRLDRVIVIGAATAEAITPNDDEADPSPSLQMFNRNTKIVDATTNIIIVQGYWEQVRVRVVRLIEPA